MAAKHTIRVEVNGISHECRIEPRQLLSDLLRLELGVTGPNVGCEQGVCGACTVLLDGQSARSCLTFAIQANKRKIETVEGLSSDPDMQLIQSAFKECHAVQCGYCTPGFLTTTFEFLHANPCPTDLEIEEALANNMCRCTGYTNIKRAVRLAAEGLADRSAGTREGENA